MASPRLRSVIGAALVLVATGVFAQDTSTNQVAVEKDWSVFEGDTPRECWAVAAPKETVNTRDGRIVSVNRGDILLMAFFRPKAGNQGQITFSGGYEFATGSKVTMDIDGTAFQLFTDGEWSWPESAADDAAIITAMKRGRSAVLTGLSQRSKTTTKDSFSLSGFTAAIEEAQARCK